MALLAAEHYRVISLAECVRRLEQRLPLRGYVALTFDDAYRDFLANVLPVLEHYRYPATLFVPTGLLGGASVWDSYDKSKPLMTWPELAEAQYRGVTVASHTVTHSRLTECDDRRLAYELQTSLDMLRERLDEVFPALAYPGGDFGLREQKAARQAGYICALGVTSRWGNGPETNLYHLRREKPA
jgi:peptidoglycan/xylan/chitin deacetylase (PgdA/CDA1 family)